MVFADLPRVSEVELARILQLITTTPNRREKPLASDPKGDFQFWFDGGACASITGSILFKLSDGIEVSVWVRTHLHLVICFPNGVRVEVIQKPNVDEMTGKSPEDTVWVL